EGDVEPSRVAARLGVLLAAQPGGQQGLHGEQQAGQQDQDRDDDVERLARGGEQQDAAGRPAEGGDDTEADQPAALADVLLPEAGDAAEVAGPLCDGVRDVRVDGGQAEGDQGREEDQRPAAGDRVDPTGEEGDAGGDGQVEGGHDCRDYGGSRGAADR